MSWQGKFKYQQAGIEGLFLKIIFPSYLDSVIPVGLVIIWRGKKNAGLRTDFDCKINPQDTRTCRSELRNMPWPSFQSLERSSWRFVLYCFVWSSALKLGSGGRMCNNWPTLHSATGSLSFVYFTILENENYLQLPSAKLWLPANNAASSEV